MSLNPSFQELRTGMGYPDVPLPKPRQWDQLPSHYTPIYYTAESVKRAVPDWENPDPEVVWQRAKKLSSVALSRDPTTGLPRNPAGATGISGHGRLRELGPNLSADIAAIDKDHVLLIKRKDTGQLAFPGGFIDEQPDGTYEDALDAGMREVFEETGIIIQKGVAKYALLNAGVANLSLRNTDHAWVENTIHVADASGMPPHKLIPIPDTGDDAKEARWHRLGEVDVRRMSDMHADNFALLTQELQDGLLTRTTLY